MIGLASACNADAAPKCTLAKVADLPVRLERNHLIVDGTVNGQKVGVMLDTGARTFVVRPAAVRLGLPRRDARNYRIFGVGGETKAEITQIDEFTMGPIVRKDWPIFVASERDFGEGIAVVLGEEYLQRFDVEFDLANRSVRLFEHQPKDCEGVSLAYWASAGASEVGIEPLKTPGAGAPRLGRGRLSAGQVRSRAYRRHAGNARRGPCEQRHRIG